MGDHAPLSITPSPNQTPVPNSAPHAAHLSPHDAPYAVRAPPHDAPYALPLTTRRMQSPSRLRDFRRERPRQLRLSSRRDTSRLEQRREDQQNSERPDGRHNPDIAPVV